jgi:hypothetical protein
MVSQSINIQNKWVKSLIIIVSGMLVAAVFFRVSLFSHETLDFGDGFEALITFSIIHHWYNVFQGLEHWRDLNYFYPYTNTLGYNDGYFLYGVLYSLFRVLKIKAFLALGFTNITIRLIGFYSFFYLCYKKLNLRFFICLLMAAVFSLSNAVYNEAIHAQIFSVSFAPLLTIFLMNYMQRLLIVQHTGKAIAWGSIAGIFYGSWLLSAYYMSWFYTLFAFFWITFMLILQYRHKQPLNLKKPAFLAILLPAIITLVALVPFLMVYLPAALQTGMHHFFEARIYTPSIFNLINVGDQNILWGRLISYFHFQSGEFPVGFPFIFFIILIAAMIASIKDTRQESINFYRPIAYAIIASVFVSVIVAKVSLWYLIWAVFPGAKGLRVVCRYWIYLVFPMSILIAYYLSERKIWSSGLISFLLPVLLILEQLNTLGVGLYLKAEQVFIDSLTPMPSQCQAFFAVNTRREERDYWGPLLNNADAMLIAEIIEAKTINGVSTFSPPDSNFNYYPQNTYLDRVKIYAKNHNIQILCSFDLKDMKWRILER